MATETEEKLHPEDSEEPIKPVREILETELLEGLNALHRPFVGLLISAVSGGLDIGFSLFLMATMLSRTQGQLPQVVTDMLVATMYSVGFLFVVLGRSELFTEHTTLAVVPVQSGHASWLALARLWVLVYVGNLVGVTIFAALAIWIGPGLGVIRLEAFGTLGHQVIDHDATVIFGSAVLAGWLMGLMSWLVAAGRDTTSQVLLVFLVASAIGICRLHHVVVGSVEVLAGVFAGQGITLGDFGHFLLFATLGNVVGGGFFVGFLKYNHGSRAGRFHG